MFFVALNFRRVTFAFCVQTIYLVNYGFVSFYCLSAGLFIILFTLFLSGYGMYKNFVSCVTPREKNKDLEPQPKLLNHE